MLVNMRLLWIYGAIIGLVWFSCQSKSPEELPKFKRKFKAQIASFEAKKDKADDRVEEGVETLNGLQAALEEAQNVDQEFKRVYGRWNKVDKQVEDLFKEYERLKEDASNLFAAMERQTASLRDEQTRGELTNAINTTKQDYDKVLARTEEAIGQLNTLHTDAVDIIKALEVAVALGQIAEISTGLETIEAKVENIMTELNATVVESKDLYESRIEAI